MELHFSTLPALHTPDPIATPLPQHIWVEPCGLGRLDFITRRWAEVMHVTSRPKWLTTRYCCSSFPFFVCQIKAKDPKAPGDSSASSEEPAGPWIIAWDCLPGTWYGLMGATKKSWLCYWLLEDLLITEASFALISIPGQPKGNRSSLNLRSPQRENGYKYFAL